jgi:hypothetical protein
LFASFHSSDHKSRSKFLDVLRCGHKDYVLNEAAWSYWPLAKQGRDGEWKNIEARRWVTSGAAEHRSCE